MCGRASLATEPDSLHAALRPLGVRDLPPWYRPRYNVAPTQDHLVVIQHPDGRRELRAMRWGLVPSWARDPAIGDHLINARSETVATKPSFRDALRKRRGLIVVDGYYEWRREARGPRTPFRIHHADGRPMLLAALWERWAAPDGVLETCAVVTRAAAGGLETIHERMPVILSGDDTIAWLDPATSPVRVGALLASEPAAGDVRAYAVTTYVNAPHHDDAECWTPALA